MKAIKRTETGANENCHNINGKSADHGCLQYQMPTYRMESIRVLGYEAPFTKVNAEYIATLTITKKLEKGKSVEQIMLEHNQGSGTTCRKGVNKYGTRYDSCSYLEKAMNYYNNLK